MPRIAQLFFSPIQWGNSYRRFRHGPHPSHCGERAFFTKSMLHSNIASTSSLGTSALSVSKGCFNCLEGKSARFDAEGILPNQGAAKVQIAVILRETE